MPPTTIYNRGAVVLLPFPFSDQSAAKIRPAVIVSPHYPSDDLLVVAVTSVGAELRPGEFPILRKAVGTAKYANHAKTERIGEKDRFTQQENGFFSSTFSLSRVWGISRFELPDLARQRDLPSIHTERGIHAASTLEWIGALWPNQTSRSD